MIRRRRVLLIAFAALGLIVGLVSWSQHRRQQQFVGEWALRDTGNPEGPPGSISSLTRDGSMNQLMWYFGPDAPRNWVGPDWWLRGNYLYLEEPRGAPGIRSTASFLMYWTNRLLGRGSQRRLRVVEITSTRMRLSDETLGAMPSVYDRVAPVE